MANPSYVEFEIPKDVSDKIVEALGKARQSKAASIRKGVNEVTKSIERGLPVFVVMAADVQPPEVVMHIPQLCKQRKIAFGYVPTKLELGKAIGLNVPCAAVAVEKPGEAEQLIKEVASKIAGKTVDVSAPKAEKKAAPEKKAEKKPAEHKAEAKPEQKPAPQQEAKPEAPAAN